MNEDLYKNVLVLTIKNGNIVLLPYTGEYDKETTLSSKTNMIVLIHQMMKIINI